MKARPVFIVGPPRSGTTLLQSILASHSTVDTLPETHFFENVIPALGQMYFDPNSEFPICGIPTIRKELLRAGFDLGWEKDERKFKGQTTKSIFEYLVSSYIDPSSLIFVEKTPGHARYIPQIRIFYPDAAFIAVVRHPVESVGSMWNMHPLSLSDTRFPRVKSLIALTTLWKHCCKTILDNRNDNLKLIKYEDLVQEPEATVRNLCDFLGIEYESKMLLDFGTVSKKFVRISVSPWKKENLSGNVRDNRYKWRNRLSSGKVWLIEECAQALMGDLDYTRTAYPGIVPKKLTLLEEKTVRLFCKWKLESRIRKYLINLKKLIAVITG